MSKVFLFLFFFTLTLAPYSSDVLASPRPTPEGAHLNFDIKLPPNSADWQRFYLLTPEARQNLWDFHARKKIPLKGWAWQWRLGWIRVCGEKKQPLWCDDVLRQGMLDQAMVVRSEAAETYALVHKGRVTPTVIARLAQAYQLKENFKDDRPLFVCERILSAIKSLGTKEAIKTGAKLAKAHPKSLAYWTALNREAPMKAKDDKTVQF
jgi:hypothetical protein